MDPLVYYGLIKGIEFITIDGSGNIQGTPARMEGQYELAFPASILESKDLKEVVAIVNTKQDIFLFPDNPDIRVEFEKKRDTSYYYTHVGNSFIGYTVETQHASNTLAGVPIWSFALPEGESFKCATQADKNGDYYLTQHTLLHHLEESWGTARCYTSTLIQILLPFYQPRLNGQCCLSIY